MADDEEPQAEAADEKLAKRDPAPAREAEGAKAAGDDGATSEDTGQDEDDAAEEYGSDKLSADLLDQADEQATASRALDATLRSFGFQTNQQINNFFGGTPVRVKRTALPEETLARVRASFVAPPGYTALWDRVEDRGLVILGGPAGCGRRHTATYVLDAVCDARIHQLTGGSVADLDPAGITEHTGYLWCDLRHPEDEPVPAYEVERLVEVLRVRHSRMIILSPPAADWSFELTQYRHELAGPPDLDAVLRRHLAASGAAEQRVEDLLRAEAVVAARNELTSASAAAGLGTALIDVLAGRCTAEQAVARAQARAEGTAEWFSRLTNRGDRALALALATLDKLPYSTVIAGARHLDHLVQQAEDPENMSKVRPFEQPARRLLEAVEATRARGVLQTSYGDIPVTTLSSSRERFPQQMLDTLWQDFPYLQEIYLDWLQDLVGTDDPYVRERAAVATGILAEGDFDFVRGRLLLDWAGSADVNVRRAAGVALRVPALNPRLRDIVWKMLDDWASEKKNRTEVARDHHRRLAAAAALGGPVGATDFARALDLITDRLLKYRPAEYPYRYWSVIGRAVVELFGDGGSAQSSAVLGRMQQWVEKGETGPVNVAIAGLIGIVGRPPERGVADTRRLPPIIRAVDGDDDNRKAAAGLWRHALNHRVMGPISIRAVKRLAAVVEAADDCDGAFVDLICAIPQTAREGRTLAYHARTPDRGLPQPAVLDLLHQQLRRYEVTR